MRHTTIKQFVMLLGLMLPTVWCGANDTHIYDGHSHINIKVGSVQGAPKGYTINASIDGHTLIVVFSENLGQVNVEIAMASGVSVQFTTTQTPNGLQCYIPNTGDYIVTFTLSNGDEYYGEFIVTD